MADKLLEERKDTLLVKTMINSDLTEYVYDYGDKLAEFTLDQWEEILTDIAKLPPETENVGLYNDDGYDVLRGKIYEHFRLPSEQKKKIEQTTQNCVDNLMKDPAVYTLFCNWEKMDLDERVNNFDTIVNMMVESDGHNQYQHQVKSFYEESVKLGFIRNKIIPNPYSIASIKAVASYPAGRKNLDQDVIFINKFPNAYNESLPKLLNVMYHEFTHQKQKNARLDSKDTFERVIFLNQFQYSCGNEGYDSYKNQPSEAEAFYAGEFMEKSINQKLENIRGKSIRNPYSPYEPLADYKAGNINTGSGQYKTKNPYILFYSGLRYLDKYEKGGVLKDAYYVSAAVQDFSESLIWSEHLRPPVAMGIEEIEKILTNEDLNHSNSSIKQAFAAGAEILKKMKNSENLSISSQAEKSLNNIEMFNEYKEKVEKHGYYGSTHEQAKSQDPYLRYLAGKSHEKKVPRDINNDNPLREYKNALEYADAFGAPTHIKEKIKTAVAEIAYGTDKFPKQWNEQAMQFIKEKPSDFHPEMLEKTKAEAERRIVIKAKSVAKKAAKK